MTNREKATVTLSEFLIARIAEDEAAAQGASPGPWRLNAEGYEVLAVDDVTAAEAHALSGERQQNTAAHIARYDPTRVQAECEAKRRIVQIHTSTSEEVDHGLRSGEKYWTTNSEPAVPCSTLMALALPYAEHPDFRDEWRS